MRTLVLASVIAMSIAVGSCAANAGDGEVTDTAKVDAPLSANEWLTATAELNKAYLSLSDSGVGLVEAIGDGTVTPANVRNSFEAVVVGVEGLYRQWQGIVPPTELQHADALYGKALERYAAGWRMALTAITTGDADMVDESASIMDQANAYLHDAGIAIRDS